MFPDLRTVAVVEPDLEEFMKIGVLELLSSYRYESWTAHLVNRRFKRGYASITPQAVSVWCRQWGHDVHYATFYGQNEPRKAAPRSTGCPAYLLPHPGQLPRLRPGQATASRKDLDRDRRAARHLFSARLPALLRSGGAQVR